jgi:flavin-dependent dehydrogenase
MSGIATVPPHFDAVVIGGGPAGAVIGRLLASWAHSVRILNKAADRSRGLAESLPPSTRKLLAEVGVLDAVDRAGFYRTTGNTAWWASSEPRAEAFDPSGQLAGYQVFRPDLDRVLIDSAAEAGAEVCAGATVRRVRVDDEPFAVVEYEENGRRSAVSCRFVLDCSGRAGVLGQHYRQPEPRHRLYALVGVWHRADDSVGWGLTDETHTLVETYQDGWAWSVPISAATRHVGTMVDGTSPRVTAGRALRHAYEAEIGKTARLAPLLEAATLERVFACDASLYSAHAYGGSRFLLVGDAGSFIDPLSSFGVKKALASAWVGAVVVHTCLMHPDRQPAAIEFFSGWEREVYATHLRRSRDFARAAHARHPHPFWALRAETEVGPPALDEAERLHHPDVRSALDALKERPTIDLVLDEQVELVKQPVIRGREIVLEDALPIRAWAGLKACATSAPQPAIRFLANVDLLGLAQMTGRYRQVPELFAAYCQTYPPVPLPALLGGLAFLVAEGILKPRV